MSAISRWLPDWTASSSPELCLRQLFCKSLCVISRFFFLLFSVHWWDFENSGKTKNGLCKYFNHCFLCYLIQQFCFVWVSAEFLFGGCLASRCQAQELLLVIQRSLPPDQLVVTVHCIFFSNSSFSIWWCMYRVVLKVKWWLVMHVSIDDLNLFYDTSE